MQEALERRRAAARQVQREQIVEGFASVAAAKGYAAVTIGDVARAARVSKSSFYEHFADKEAVYLHLHSRVADALMAAMSESLERTAAEPDWRRRVSDLVRARLECMAANPAFLTQVRIEPEVATPAAREARRAAGRRSAAIHRRLSEQLAASVPEIAPLPSSVTLAGLAGTVELVARAAERGPGAVRRLEPVVTDLWARLMRVP